MSGEILADSQAEFIQALARRATHQRIDADPEKSGDLRQQLNVGTALRGFPFAHGLIGHAQIVGKLFLRAALLFAQQRDAFIDFHSPSHSVVFVSHGRDCIVASAHPKSNRAIV